MDVGGRCGAGCGGTATQPASMANAAISNARAAQTDEAAMILIFLEAALALVLLVLIVWWTMPSKRKRPPAAPRDTPPSGPQ